MCDRNRPRIHITCMYTLYNTTGTGVYMYCPTHVYSLLNLYWMLTKIRVLIFIGCLLFQLHSIGKSEFMACVRRGECVLYIRRGGHTLDIGEVTFGVDTLSHSVHRG